MHLKRIKLRNFKSFAGATEVPFQPGFTGVAGPNGMGKSNISDAILFVLGPTSSKALRAERLTHLFFNGGAAKKAATECEVSLVFDNRDRLLPVDTDEVEVTRYVKLAPSDPDGYYSYFYVNGKRTTQGEIDLVLSHGRLSGDGYNLVQQGDVNRIVSMTPVARRGLVERLAGISQYDEELARADAKRADLEANLSRIQTLLGEVRNRIAALESQRMQAMQYKQFEEEKRKAEARLARAGFRLAQQEAQTCQGSLDRIDAELGKLREAVGRLEGDRGRIDSEIARVDREIADRGGPEAAKFKTELDEKRLAFARLEENVQRAQEELAALSERLQGLSGQVARETKEVHGLADREKALSAALATVEHDHAEQSERLRRATGDAEESQGKVAGVQAALAKLEASRTAKEKLWQESVQRLEAARAAVQGAEREVAQAEDDRGDRELELKETELRVRQGRPESVERGSRSSPEMQKELFEVKAKEKRVSAEAERLAGEVLELNRRYMALDARLKARAEGGARPTALAAVDFILSQRNLGRLDGIRGTVEELAEYDPKYRTALQVAGGARFQGIVVETDQVAEECIKLLRSEKRGRATFLPLNKMLAGRPRGKSLLVAQGPGAQGFAIDLVKFEEALRPAFWYVFGETVLMNDLPSARSQMGGVRLVTVDGDLIEATGAISGGYLEHGERGRGADSAMELKRLGDELRARSAEEADARAELARLAERLRSLSEELARRSAQAEAHQSTSKLLEAELGAARERLADARKRVEAAAAAHARSAQAAEVAEAAAREQAATLDAIKSEHAKLQADYLARLPGAVSAKIRTIQEALAQAAERRVEAARELEGAAASLKAARALLATHETELASAKSEREAKAKQAANLARQRDGAREGLEALKSVEAKQLAAVRGLADERQKLDSSRLKTVESLARTQETVRNREQMRQGEEIRLAQAQAHLAEVEKAISDLPPEADDGPAVPVDALKRTIQTLEAQMASLGAVNLRAVEEYDTEKSRLEEFGQEVSRLTGEKSDLQGLVAEIEKKKRSKLIEVVDAVNLGYRTIYSELSGGGQGEIALENSEDPLSGGLMIRASPVGKIVRRLEQLSGGEKSLASLAFIFALQRFDPSPLYVFDEVDMSLDGVNAENVGRMLRRNSESAQFVVISLRKVTLKFAHRLFGVTMHGDGCSRVVGLRLDEIVDVDERDQTARAAERPPEAAA